MGEQHAQSDLRAARIVGRVEVGKVRLHRFVDPNPAFFVELHDGGRGREALRQRGQVEDGVLGHRLRRGG
jgi:hypothetical protein